MLKLIVRNPNSTHSRQSMTNVTGIRSASVIDSRDYVTFYTNGVAEHQARRWDQHGSHLQIRLVHLTFHITEV